MPTYTFKNKTTGVEWEKFMRMSEVDDYKKENDCSIIITGVNIASGQGDNIDAKTDAGWKETLSKISEAHPKSELAKQYGKRKSSTDVKIEQVRKKHKDIAKRRIQKITPLK
jgi:L-asparaginase/Glu-tRNA(Gln) amidotransferase subunit D